MNQQAGPANPIPETARLAILSKQGWGAASLLLVLSSFVSKALGVVRDLVIAKYFGAGITIDAFQVAISVASILGSGTGIATATAIVPQYTRISVNSGSGHANRFASQVFCLVLLFSLALSTLVTLLPSLLVSASAPHLPFSTFQSASNILKSLAMMVLGLNLIYILTAFFHASHHFRIPVVGELLSQVTVVLSLLFFSASWGINSLVWGMILGLYASIVLQSALLSRVGFFQFGSSIQWMELKSFLGSFLPILVCDYTWHAQLILQNMVSSGLPAGTISSLAYASSLRNAVIAVVATNVARGSYPQISDLVSRTEFQALRALISRILRYLTVCFVPISIFCSVNSVQIVQTMFMRGKFDATASIRTASAFTIFSWGLLFSSVIPVFLRVCYASKMLSHSLIAMACGVLTFFGLSITLTPTFGIVGIALSSTLALLPTVVLLGIAVRKSMGGLDWQSPARILLFACLASFVGIIPCWIWPPRNAVGLTLIGAVFVSLYFGTCSLLLQKDLRSMLTLIKGKPRAGM